MEFFHKPKCIIVQDEKIVLVFRYRREREFPWDQIEWIRLQVNEGVFRRLKDGGMLKIKNSLPYPINPEIGKIISSEYYKKNGHYPPEKPGVVPWN